jgi:hypothetical protein
MMTTNLKALARIGAETRIAQLRSELDEIYSAFPDLRSKSEKAGARQKARPTGRRKSRSAAAKKAASDRMKKYWADKRKTEKK